MVETKKQAATTKTTPKKAEEKKSTPAKGAVKPKK